MSSKNEISLINGKEIAFKIIDGDQRTPREMAKNDGLLNSTESVDIDSTIQLVLEKNKSTVEKIKASGKEGPIMFLVGQVMKELKNSGDAKEITSMIRLKLGLK